MISSEPDLGKGTWSVGSREIGSKLEVAVILCSPASNEQEPLRKYLYLKQGLLRAIAPM